MLTSKNYGNFPSIVEITSLLDCSVLEDSEYGGEIGRDRHFWLGDAGDVSVGILPFTASPAFSTLQGLNQFCKENQNQFISIASQIDKTGDYPETWFWQDASPTPKNKVRP